MENTMKALVLEGVGEPLLIKEVPVPAIGEQHALVRLKTAAFNRRDWWIQRGQYAGLKFPIILGSDGAGVVDAVGDTRENGQWVGRDVIINPGFNWVDDSEAQPAGFEILGLPENGTFAEYVRVPVRNLYEKPEYLSFEEAAALPLGGVTSYRALFRKAGLSRGERILITGVGGGVATLALQWAVNVGAEVYVTSGSESKIKRAIDGGAIAGVDYRNADWADRLKELAGGFDVIVDSALGDGFVHLLELANPGGRIVFFGGTSGNLPALDGRRIFWKQLQIKGTTMGSSVDFENMLALAEKHQIKPLIDSVIPWQRAQEGIYKMSSSTQFGKIVLKF